MSTDEIAIGKKYKITYKDKYFGRTTTAIKICRMGDVTLQFKNKNEVMYHAGWLEPA